MAKRNKKQLLFSVTSADVVFQMFSGSGAGGQHRNKHANCVRCIHKPSGARAQSTSEKSLHRNKRIAFRRMAETQEFQKWVRLEAARRSGELQEIERKVDKSLRENTRVEVHDENGLWVEWEDE